jgi:hypothetical protein
MTIVEAERAVTGGVDSHLDLNVAAALDGIGGVLGVKEFPTTAVGHCRLLGWLSQYGTVSRVGVEGTGSYGAGLARFLRGAVSRWSRSTAPTARPAAARESPTPSTPSRRPGRPRPNVSWARPKPGTATWKPSGRWW